MRELFREEPFLEEERFPPVLRELDFLEEVLRGTFAPFARASDSPMAIACLRLFTVPPFPPRPLFSVPFFRRRIALPTLLLAAVPYFRVPDFLPDFFLVAMKSPGSSQRTPSTRRASASVIPLRRCSIAIDVVVPAVPLPLRPSRKGDSGSDPAADCGTPPAPIASERTTLPMEDAK